jgi:hypothetical protein
MHLLDQSTSNILSLVHFTQMSVQAATNFSLRLQARAPFNNQDVADIVMTTKDNVDF